MVKVTQRDKLKGLFLRNPDTWVSLKEIIFLGIAMYPPRIKELRTSRNEGGEGMSIENKLEMVDGVKHSFYRYNKPNVSPPYQMKLGSNFEISR